MRHSLLVTDNIMSSEASSQSFKETVGTSTMQEVEKSVLPPEPEASSKAALNAALEENDDMPAGETDAAKELSLIHI